MNLRLDEYLIELPYGRTSGEVRVKCPFPGCQGRKPENRNDKDLSINLDKRVYHCNHCDVAGKLDEDRVTLHANGNGHHRNGHVPYGAPLSPAEARPITYQKPKPLPPDDGLGESGESFFASRGIPREVAERFGVVTTREFCPMCRATVTALAYPYHRNGEVIHVKFRHKPKGESAKTKHMWSSKDTERGLYNAEALHGESLCLLVEGEGEVLAVATASDIPCASLPDGAPDPRNRDFPQRFAFLQAPDVERSLAGMRTVLIGTDMDEPGERAAQELARRIGIEKCRRVKWPEGCNDATDTLRDHGPDRVRECIERASAWPVEGIFTVDDLWDDVESLYHRGRDTGRRVGWKGVDRNVRARQGLLAIVTGYPSGGKSEFVDNWVERLARVHNWRIGITSPEARPLHDHLSRFAQRRVGKPFDAIPEFPGLRMSLDELRAAREGLSRSFAFILPDSPTVDAIIDRARIEVYRTGLHCLVIDPWTELEHARPHGMNEQDYYNQSLSKLRDFAIRSNVYVILVAHTTKPRREIDPDTGKYRYAIPDLYDISGSAMFRNKADHGITVHREESTFDTTSVVVTKVRFRETGEQYGATTMTLDPKTLMFRDDAGDTDLRPSELPDPW